MFQNRLPTQLDILAVVNRLRQELEHSRTARVPSILKPRSSNPTNHDGVASDDPTAASMGSRWRARTPIRSDCLENLPSLRESKTESDGTEHSTRSGFTAERGSSYKRSNVERFLPYVGEIHVV